MGQTNVGQDNRGTEQMLDRDKRVTGTNIGQNVGQNVGQGQM